MITLKSVTESSRFQCFCNYLADIGFEFGHDKYIQAFVLTRTVDELQTVNLELDKFLIISLDKVFFKSLAMKVQGWGVSEIFIVLLMIARFKIVNRESLINWGFKFSVAEKVVSSYP